MKRNSTRVTAMLLSLLFIFTAFSNLTMQVSAAAEHIEIYMIDYPRGGGTDTWGHPALNFMSGWKISSARTFSTKAAVNKGMKVAYCVQPGVSLSIGDESPEVLPKDFLENYDNGSLTSGDIQQLIGRIFQYGYTGIVDYTLSDDAISEMIATQLLVWEVIVGERDSEFGRITPPANLDRIRDTIKAEHPLRTEILAHYNRIATSVQNHSKIPSFMKPSLAVSSTHELAWDGSKYSVTLTDANSVLSNFTFSSTTSGVSFTVSGNKLTISTATPPTGTIEIQANKSGSKCSAITFWCSNKLVVKGEVQALVMSGQEISDPIQAFMKAKVSAGTLNIIKTTKNNGGQVSGFRFRVTKDGTNIGTYTSSDDGRISIPNLVVGWYSVEEINLSDDFVQPVPNLVDVEVKGGQTATVSFDNVKKLGVITVQKTNSNSVMGDYSLSGAEFTVRNSDGTVVDTIVTDADGRGGSKPLPLGTYTVTESKAPYGFVRDKNTYTRTLSGALGTTAIVYCPEVSIPERPQTGQIKITKLDTETAAAAQGAATLSGAVFDLLGANGQQVERLYCGNDSFIISKEVPLGSYVVKEVIPPRGYTLSQKEYPVTIEYAGQDVEINLVSTKVKNTVIKGKIQLVKHSDDPDSAIDPDNQQVQEPLEGIVFEVRLKTAGSYENAKPSERDRITTDKNGYASTKLLPYGTYIVTEVQGKPEHKVCDPFEVFISEDGRTYYYIVENPAYSGRVKIVKTDAETGRAIPQANVEFKIKNTDTGEWVAQEILYPTPVIIDSYLTAADGTLVMPQVLHYGNYELHEIKSPYGYLLSDKPVPFKVTSENPQVYLEVKMPNKPVMGRVTVEKTGKMLVGTDKIIGKDHVRYIPKYEVRSLPGAVFDIIARNDIVTPDGTVRAEAGTVVDTITTNADGQAHSKLLYLGDYYAVEKTAPFEMVLDTSEQDFSLVYENQITPVVFAQIGVYDRRQTAELNLEKLCEMPDNAPQDYNPYTEILFGLFAREDILAVDGTVAIPKDELLEYIFFDKDGKAATKTDLPFGSFYAKELMTGIGYELDETEYDFVFDYTGQDAAVVKITVNDGKPIENKLQRGSLKVIKTFEGRTTPIEGVPFTITGKTDAGTEVTIQAETDEKGEILLEGLLTGQYKIQELDSDLTVGYILSPEENAVVAAGQIAELTLENKLQKGDLKIIKTFEGRTTPIKGVKFTIEGISVTGIPFFGEFFTDENGEISVTLPVGEYRVKEIASDLTEGYILSEEQTLQVAYNQITEMRIENKLIIGMVKIHKVDAADGKPVEGAVFGLRDKDGTLIAKASSDSLGWAEFLNIPYGDYEIFEIEAAPSYIKTDAVYQVKIREHDVIIAFEVPNEKIPDNPKTGDSSNLPLWIGLMAASFAGLAGMLLMKKRGPRKTK
ncbi:MAG: Cys-Gln thioester bond-forming surface protein [Oscillospiraceae bacterium]|jgi:LPXTG-motif cell wall-anchored protein|nr:Cys-Gln thioester bond-forming surface protein [Oscillospiraceae bacterium]